MTTAETMKLIGKRAEISLSGLTVQIEITDVKLAYGRTRYQVTPVAGHGSVWIESVHIIGETEDICNTR